MNATFTCPTCGRRGSIKKAIPPGAKVRCLGCQSRFSPEPAQEDTAAGGEGATGMPKWVWGLIAFAALVMVGVAFLTVSTSRKMANDRQVAAANRDVAEAISEAESKLVKGDFNKAEELVRKALSIENATAKSEAQTMLAEISKARGIAQAKSLLSQAQEELRSQNISSCIETLRNVLRIEDLPAKVRSVAEELLTEADLATSRQKVTELLMKLSDVQFDAIFTSGELPVNLKLTNELLNKAFLDTCLAVKKEASQSREQEKKKRLDSLRAEARRQNVGREFLRLADAPAELTGYGRLTSSRPISISPDRRLIAFGKHGIIQVRDLETGRQIAVLGPPKGAELDTSHTAFSRDSRFLATHITMEVEDKQLATKSTAHRIALWDALQGRLVGEVGTEHLWDTMAITSRFILAAGPQPGGDVPFKENVDVYELESHKIVYSFKNHKDFIRCLVVSPDERYAVSGGDERIAILWEIETGRGIRIFDAHESSVYCALLFPGREAVAYRRR